MVTTILLSVAAAIAVYALLRYTAPRWYVELTSRSTVARGSSTVTDTWEEAVAKVKEERTEAEKQSAIEIPTQLRHYSDTRWFLASQVAEVRKHNLQTSQDFVDLAAMIERREMVPLPALTETYILYGVGGTADDQPFSRRIDDRNVSLYTEAQLRDAFARLDGTRANLQSEISGLKAQLSALKRSNRARQRELNKEIAARQQGVTSADDEKALLTKLYEAADTRQRLFADYQSLQGLAKDFAGRSYNLDVPSDRQAMKVNMLRSLRPQALKVMEEIAAKYHTQFGRRLPVSSLVRPEQYQQALRRVNRNAVMIDTPPHSTGLAFDIDYRYMAAAEQSFVMSELARLKDEGRIEVLRERSANYHVFVFLDGRRPSEELITASLEQSGGAPDAETNHAAKKPAKKPSKPERPRKTQRKAKAKKHR